MELGKLEQKGNAIARVTSVQKIRTTQAQSRCSMGFTACPVPSAALCTAAKGLRGSSFLHRSTLLQSKGTALSIFVLCSRSHKGIKHWNSATISQAPDSQMLAGCFHWLEELIVFSHHLSFLSGPCSASFSDHCIFTFYVKRQIKMKNVCFLKMSNEA